MSDDFIAEREYLTVGGASIVVRFVKPQPSGRDRVCDMVFTGALERRMTAHGVDSVQALYEALKGASVQLHFLEPAAYWFEPGDQLGLPIPASLIDLVQARKGDPL